MGSLLRRAAVFKRRFDVVLPEEVLPGVLVFTLQRGEHDSFFVREGKQLVLHRVEKHSLKRSEFLKTVVVDDLPADLGDDRDVRGVHEDDVEHGDGEAAWDLILGRLQSTLFLHIWHVLQVVFLQNETVEALRIR